MTTLLFPSGGGINSATGVASRTAIGAPIRLMFNSSDARTSKSGGLYVVLEAFIGYGVDSAPGESLALVQPPLAVGGSLNVGLISL